MEFEDLVDPDTVTTSPGPDVRLLNVLVLDYVAETRHATCEALAGAGLNISSAESLEAGLDALRNQQPDALVISIDAPGLDGHALCEVIHGAFPARTFAMFVIDSSPAGDGLEWRASIPGLRVVSTPVTAKKLTEGLARA